ncbi:glutathione S-transferase 1-like [Lytechinus variegatus]|uniref:glutathione S-transferase 1-like n=1 Tax=Lytechinus variegatus TaxID=7654 RepID=UPI001BB17F04|nr:glutathione S-transferase 1-like [Lytechinus variegatus]
MPSYKLIYFDARARGEPARMLFALKGQEFEDVRFAYGDQEWLKVKGDKARFPLGRLPVLEIDGKILSQSRAVWRYLAREFGYYGNNNKESSAIDEILGVVVDFEVAMATAFDEPDADKRVAGLLKLRDTKLKPFYEFFEESLHKSGGIYYVGNKLTLADLVIFNIMDFFIEGAFYIKDYFMPYPSLLNFYKFIKTESVLSAYLKARKYTPY